MTDAVRAPHPFIVYTAGRSRTAWLASFLTYRDCHCHFETLSWQPNIEAALKILKPGTGSAESSAALIWKQFEVIPNLKRVVVRRLPKEILLSLIEAIDGRLPIDWTELRKIIERVTAKLDEISLLPGTLTVQFDELRRSDVCREVFEHCLPYAFDREWWKQLTNKIIEVDVIEFWNRHLPKPNAV